MPVNYYPKYIVNLWTCFMPPQQYPEHFYTRDKPLEAGSMLAACPFLTDAPFHRRLLLLAEHSQTGSMAFVLNEYSGYRLGELLPGFDGFDLPVWTGGPVESNTLHIVQVQSAGLAGSTELAPGIWWNAYPTQTMHLAAEGQLDKKKWHFFLGYAGWSPQQLQSEYEERVWIAGNYNPRFLPQMKQDNLWAQFLQTLGEPYTWLSTAPCHPSLN